MKMSWGNCSVKVSWPYGDFHDEPEGVAPRGPGPGRPGGKDHQPGRRRRVAPDHAAISAAQAAGARGWPSGAPASESWAAFPPPPPGGAGGAGASPPTRSLRRLQRYASDREAARGPQARRLARIGAPLTPGAREARRPSAPARPASDPTP